MKYGAAAWRHVAAFCFLLLAVGSGTAAPAGTARTPSVATAPPPTAKPRTPSAMAAAPMSLGALLATTPADSLIGPLRRYETDRSMAAAAGEAALTLGRLHAARGEYRPAAEAFARAAARLDPARKPEARLWLGFAWLALGATDQARAALDEVASVPGPHRAAARLALAQAWDAARRPDRAAAVLEGLLADDPGEAAPAALDRLATLDDDAGHADRARRLRERLLRDFPRSIEAAAARRAVFSAAAARPDERRVGGIAVVIGSFLDEARARSLASAARSAGFSGATVVSQGQGLAAVHSVRIGVFATAAEAHRAADQAEKALGVAAELTRP